MSNNPKETKVDPVKILEAFRRNNPTIIKGDAISTPDKSQKDTGESKLTTTLVNGILDK